MIPDRRAIQRFPSGCAFGSPSACLPPVIKDQHLGFDDGTEDHWAGAITSFGHLGRAQELRQQDCQSRKQNSGSLRCNHQCNALHADNVHTLTYQNGKELAYHQKVSDDLEAQGFFAHPYHSWKRGLNENTNGLVRQYPPKGKSFDDLTDQEVQIIMDRLNNGARKCLGFRTPNQVFQKEKSEIALAS